MKEVGAILFILNALIFNLFFDGQEWLQNSWYVSVYISFFCLFYEYRNRSNLMRLAVYLSAIRAIYNLGILIGLYAYDVDSRGYGILAMIITVLIITEWPKYRTS